MLGVKIAIIGIAIVFISLLSISIFISIMGYFFTNGDKIKKIIKKDKKGDIKIENEDTKETEKGIDPEVIAVITAAISVAYGPCTRIRSINAIKGGSYGLQGRLNIMSSHQPNRSRGL